MIKVVAGPSSDPVQEKLRQNKKLWNKEVSTFIDDLINFKKTMNGAPSKFFMEKGTIKDPIPSDPATIIGALAGDFQEIAQKGNALIKEQIEYAKTRKRPQPKGVKAPTAPSAPITNTPDLSKQLAAFEIKYNLIAEGSNPVSRFFTRLLTPTIGVSEAARIRKYRMSLLNACVKTYKDIGKLQVEIVKSSKESIGNSNKLLHQSWNDWMLIYRGFTTYKSNMPKGATDTGGAISVKHTEVTDDKKEVTENQAQPGVPAVQDLNSNEHVILAKAIVSDYRSILTKNYFPAEDLQAINALSNTIGKFILSSGQAKNDQSKILISEYKLIISSLQQKYGVSGNSLSEIGKAKKTKDGVGVSTASLELQVLGQNFLQKWFGKTRHQLSLFDKTSAYRLDVFKMAQEIRVVLDEIMDLLEKDMNVDLLDPLVTDINKKMTALRALMRALNAPTSLSGNEKSDKSGWFDSDKFEVL